MKTYSLTEIIAHARENSAHYREMYGQLGEAPSLEELPVVNQATFWQDNTPQDNKLLTSRLNDKNNGGIVFKSGGTTGEPKFSAYAHEEWQSFTQAFGASFAGNGFESGDLVGNLFYCGNLYASFLFIMKSLEHSGLNLTHFPFTGQMDLGDVSLLIETYQLNVLVGVPTSLIELVKGSPKARLKSVKKIFFGGEALFPEQRQFLESALPGVSIRSIGIASVDGGHVGYSTIDCGPGEHYVFTESTILEILHPDTLQPITVPQTAGKLFLTNLTRKLMPIIRYPVGDSACWMEVGKKFKVLGRTEEGARIGPVTITREDLANFWKKYRGPYAQLKSAPLQMRITRENGKDCLSLCFFAPEMAPSDRMQAQKILPGAFGQHFPMFAEHVRKELIAGLQVNWAVGLEELKNNRTGKLVFLKDLRF